MNKVKISKKQVITTIFILTCLGGYVFFPRSGAFQYRTAMFVFFALLPFLYDKLFLKENIILKGINFGNGLNNVKWSAISLVLPLVLMFILFKYLNLGVHYFLPISVKEDFGKFLLYEFTGVSFTVAMYEIFFRGFVMNFFRADFGKLAILIQFLFFALMLLVFNFNLPYWFYISYLVFSPFAGWIAYMSGSILYSFVGQLLFIIMIDAGYIALIVK